jgi:hypothetical protein
MLDANGNVRSAACIGIGCDLTAIQCEYLHTIGDDPIIRNGAADQDVATACLTLINRGRDHTVAAQVDFLRGNANVASLSFSRARRRDTAN